MPSSTKLLFLALAALLTVLVLFPRAESPPSVVVVLVDQLRKDYADEALTEVNALASRGVVFDDVRSAAPWTYPSVISMFSGLYPQQHGANGHPSKNELSVFSKSVPLLHRTLGAAGYTTSAFITNPFLREWNPFHLGFDHFDASFIRGVGNRRTPGQSWKTSQMFSDSVNEAIFAHFDKTDIEGPEFVYVHYIDVHGPHGGAPFRANYLSAVEYVDAKIAELYAYFSERYGEDLLFVVTSDHGQERGDDLKVGHPTRLRARKGSVHDFNLRIPLMVLPGRRVVPGLRVDVPASNIDLVPTLLEWLKLEDVHGGPGNSLFVAAHGGTAEPRAEPIYAVQTAFGRSSDCVVAKQRKMMRHFQSSSTRVIAEQVFDLENDPREEQSLARSLGAGRKLIERAAGTYGRAYPSRFGRVEAGTLSQLRALGYLQKADP